MVDAFDEAGFTVFEASHADEAIQILEANAEIRLIVTDIDMPGTMDGVALARYVRDRWPPIHIIVVSATEQKEDALPPGTLRFRKPIPLEVVAANITALTQQESGAAPAENLQRGQSDHREGGAR